MTRISHPLILFCFYMLLVGATSFAASEDTSSSSTYNESSAENVIRKDAQWGIELQGSANSLGDQSVKTGAAKSAVATGSMQLDFQPRGLQGLGVPSLGATFSGFPGTPIGKQPQDILFGYAAGGQVRYQARFSREQLFVPMAAYTMEYWGYNSRSAGGHGFLAQGPTLGVWLSLNSMDKKAANAFYAEDGIQHTYITLEGHAINGNDKNVTLDGRSFLVGLRMEY